MWEYYTYERAFSFYRRASGGNGQSAKGGKIPLRRGVVPDKEQDRKRKMVRKSPKKQTHVTKLSMKKHDLTIVLFLCSKGGRGHAE